MKSKVVRQCLAVLVAAEQSSGNDPERLARILRAKKAVWKLSRLANPRREEIFRAVKALAESVLTAVTRLDED